MKRSKPGDPLPGRRLKRGGLTLLEVLVSLGLISLLAAMSLSGLSYLQARTRDVLCGMNLAQWGTATHLFALDHDQLLPKDGAPNGSSRREGWYIDLPKALGIPDYHQMPWRTNAAVPPGRSLWICPANRRRSNGHNLFHYCLNQHVNGTGAGRQVKITWIASPSRMVWLFDNGKQAAVAQQNNVHTNLHLAGARFLFLDGHSRRLENKAYWDFKSNRGRLDDPALQWRPSR